MRRCSWFGGLVFLCALGFAVQAGAFLIDGTDYVFFANTALTIQNGPGTIIGPVGVNDLGGRLRIGASSTIKGIATADRVSFGAGASVDDCEFNTSTGGQPNNVCGSQRPTAALPMTDWPPFIVPVVDSCVSAGGNNLTVPAGQTASPPASSCFGAVDVKDGGWLNLSGGGAYNFKSVRLQSGSILTGNGAIVNIKGTVVTEPNVTIVNVSIYTAASRGVAIGIGTGSLLDGVFLTAPSGTVHIHSNVIVGSDVEVVAERIRVGPIINVVP